MAAMQACGAVKPEGSGGLRHLYGAEAGDLCLNQRAADSISKHVVTWPLQKVKGSCFMRWSTNTDMAIESLIKLGEPYVVTHKITNGSQGNGKEGTGANIKSVSPVLARLS